MISLDIRLKRARNRATNMSGRSREHTRREFIQALAGGATAVALGDLGIARAAEYLRLSTSESYSLDASAMRVDLGGRTVSTIGFSGSLPGPLLRATEGGRIQVQVNNHLKAGTSVHWHSSSLESDGRQFPRLRARREQLRCSLF